MIVSESTRVRARAPAVQVDQRDLVAHFFGALDRCVRSWRMYGGSGAVLDQQRAELVAAAAATTAAGEVTVRVAAFGFLWEGEPLTHDDRRGGWVFPLFGAGVRELTVLPGVDAAELGAWIAILAEDAAGPGEDVVLRHWNADLPHIRVYAVDVFDEGGLAELGEGASAPSDPVPVRFAGTGQTAVLAPDDLRLLRARDGARWAAHAHMSTPPAPARAAGLTLDDLRELVRLVLHADHGYDGPSPVLIEQFDALLREGAVGPVADLLHAVVELDAAADPLLVALCTPSKLARIAALLAADPDRLFPALDRVGGRRPDLLVPMVDLLADAELRSTLEDLLVAHGAPMAGWFARRVEDPDPEQVRHACAELGRLGSPEALRALAPPLRHPLGVVRLAALRALAGRYHPELRVELARILHDPDPEARALALPVLAGSGDARMAWAILSAVQDPAFDGWPPAEQDALYRALGAFRDPRLVPHAEALLAEKNLLRARGVVRRQLLVVAALAAGPTGPGRALLRRFAGAWHLPREVKDAIAAALAVGEA